MLKEGSHRERAWEGGGIDQIEIHSKQAFAFIKNLAFS
jgi:hypothetical protein